MYIWFLQQRRIVDIEDLGLPKEKHLSIGPLKVVQVNTDLSYPEFMFFPLSILPL